MNWITDNWTNLLAAVTSLVTAASIIARMTPSRSDDAVVDKVLQFIRWLSINAGK